MLETVANSHPPAPLAPVLLLTGNQVLALDIEQALQSIGLKAWICGTGDVGKLEEMEPGNVSAAIIDLEASDTCWPSCLSWLWQENIRTIVVSSREEPLGDGGMPNSKFPNVIAWFDMPFNVDDMLPILRMPLGGGGATPDGLPG